MTDKEMAEEYFKSVCEDYNEELERTGKRHYWVGFDIKNAYLAGLEAGRPKWHDLRKNPDDLPDKGKVAFSHVVMTNKGFREYCNTFTGEWFAAGTFELVDKPRAWCEIPEFEEV